jgi:transcription elongation GreA/GreB family factor
MSVAFRRESDEDHKEPRFELPLPPGPNLVTERGLAMMRERVAQFTAAVDAAPDDDTRAAAKRDLRYWQTRETSAQIAPIPAPGEVAFGTRVTFRLNGQTRTLDLVGADEADPDAGRITFTAPLAQAMLEAEVGETVAFNGKPDAIEILDAQPIPKDA